jgi:hypothetical protein
LSKGLGSVKTLTAKEIAKKHNLPLAVIAKKIAAGVKVEKEHTKSTKQANEIARDHLGERPDYYDKLHKMEKSKVSMEEGISAGYAASAINYAKQAYDKVKHMKEQLDIHESIKASTSYKVVHRDTKKIIAQGNKKEMSKKIKSLNAKNPGSHFLGSAPSKKVGDTFNEGWASVGHPYTRYAPGATGITKTIYEETKMDNKELINEALDCILEDNLPEMKDNLMLALQEKAMEKLEERKKEISAQYFAQ